MRPFFISIFGFIRQSRIRSILLGIGFALLIMAIILASVFFARQQSSAGILQYQLAEQSRYFIQLQRETLRLMMLVGLPPYQFDLSTVETQFALMKSRVNLLEVVRQPNTEVQQMIEEDKQQLVALYQPVEPLIEQWIAQPNNLEYKAVLLETLAEYERAVNDIEVEQSRIRRDALNQLRGATATAL